MSELNQPFDRRLLRQRRDRAAVHQAAYGYLFAEAAARLVDRLGDVRRDFPRALDLGAHDGPVARAVAAQKGGQVGSLVETDLSVAMLHGDELAVAADEELLPFAPGSFDLVLSCCSLHWVNDLPGTLAQIRTVLKPDGLFLAVMFGGETLSELRQAWLAADATVSSGVSPRVAPFADLQTAAGLLQRAGFALPVADKDRIDVTYGDPLTLMRELRGMGESNVLYERRRMATSRSALLAAAARYQDMFGREDGRIPATFELIFLTGWAPGGNQPKILRPGSAVARLADALGATEHPADD
ncbi:MAG: methyltransferase domain-containing protein [Alphaproteobacteria bacterium]